MGILKVSKGYKSTWVGYKLHLVVASTARCPISCLQTSRLPARQPGRLLPLETLSAERTTNLYDLMDAVYFAEPIRQLQPLTWSRPVD